MLSGFLGGEPLLRKDIVDIYKIRSLLEGLCVKMAVEHITEEQLEELEEVILLSEFQVQKTSGSNTDQVVNLDGRFHKILYEAANSRILCHTLMDYHKYVQKARKLSIVSKDREKESIKEHKQILLAIREKNADLAESLVKEHILHVMENLKKQGYEEI